jgi:FkbM family methyltransferase
MYLDPVSNLGNRLIREGSYEMEITNQIKSLLKEGDNFVDVGANEGYFSVLASQQIGTSGRVISIEPQERLWRIILKNSVLNNLCNIQLIPFAASDSSSELEIVLTPSVNTGSSGAVRSNRNLLWSRQKTQTLTLDKIIGDLPIKLMKIDIEGFELLALQGAEKILHSKQVKNIIVELHPKQLALLGQSEIQVTSLLNKFGYYEHEGIFKVKS